MTKMFESNVVRSTYRKLMQLEHRLKVSIKLRHQRTAWLLDGQRRSANFTVQWKTPSMTQRYDLETLAKNRYQLFGQSE